MSVKQEGLKIFVLADNEEQFGAVVGKYIDEIQGTNPELLYDVNQLRDYPNTKVEVWDVRRSTVEVFKATGCEPLIIE
jgi:hypothetical protein